VDSVEAARIQQMVRGIRQIWVVHQVATRSHQLLEAMAMARFLAVLVEVEADQQRAQTQTQSDGQAGQQGQR
jgi:adenylate cyclase